MKDRFDRDVNIGDFVITTEGQLAIVRGLPEKNKNFTYLEIYSTLNTLTCRKRSSSRLYCTFKVDDLNQFIKPEDLSTVMMERRLILNEHERYLKKQAKLKATKEDTTVSNSGQ